MREPFAQRIAGPLLTRQPECLQVNLGKLCNQACRHCHVDAGPKRTELMDLETVDQVLAAVELLGVHTVDITGGAPEMNPHFRYLVEGCRRRGIARIIDRCNLTILSEPGYEWVAPFLAEHQVEVVASLPFYEEEHVDLQRGDGVFVKSIEGLRLLNRLGYGRDIPLNLVYNPQGAYLPPDQMELRDTYQCYLSDSHGVFFNDLYTITNMPIARFATYLRISGNYERYMNKLHQRFNRDTLDSVMCRSLISVGYDGALFDCDFNQMLALPVADQAVHIRSIGELLLVGREIRVGEHCYGCTAGSGSSCGGALQKDDQDAALVV